MKIKVFVVLVLSLLLFGCGNQNSDKPLSYGELLDLKDSCVEYNEDLSCKEIILVIKAKITPSLTNKMTIDQNYYNVFDYINNHKDSINKYERINYLAVADMASGNESKAVSFEVDSEAIQNVIDGKIITAQQLSEKVNNLWILPSLQN